MSVVWQVEIDDYATRVLEKHWPRVKRWGDIKTFPPDDGQDWRVDVICGGFPCQDLSKCGSGEGLRGSRSGLFYDAVRVVRLLRPRYVLLENVATLLNRGLCDVLGALAAVGYDSEWHCLQAANFGAPHIRDRIFVVGSRTGGLSDADRLRLPVSGEQRGRELPQSNGRYCSWGENSPNPKRERLPSAGEPVESLGPTPIIGGKTDSTVTDCFWDVEPRVGRVAYGVPSRVDRLKCLGNAVVPQIATMIGREIVRNSNMEENLCRE